MLSPEQLRRGRDLRRKAISHHGSDYPSYRALARALGINIATVCAAVKKGTVEKLGTPQPRQQPLAAWEANRSPVSAHGHSWRSQAEAAISLGVSPQAVSAALDAGRFEKMVAKRLGLKR